MVQDGFAGGAGKLDPVGPEPQDPVRVAYDNMVRAMEINRAWGRIEDAVNVIENAMKGPSFEAGNAESAAELELIRAVMAANPRPLPCTEEFFGSRMPFYRHRIGGRTLLLTRNDDDTPDFLASIGKDPAAALQLVILDEPAGGAEG